jgi:hypothetical protein
MPTRPVRSRCAKKRGRDGGHLNSRVGRTAYRRCWQSPLEPLNLDGAAPELFVFHHSEVEVARRLDPVDRELEQRTVHRATARSRSGAHTMSLASIGS